MDAPALSKNRAKVIEEFIEIETLVSIIITTHYLGRADKGGALGFMREVFFDEYCTFAFKSNLLAKVIKKGESYLSPKIADGNEGVQKLRELANIRNLFAHCGPALEVNQAGAAIKITPHPKKVNELLDFDNEFKKFTDLYPQVREWLEGVKKDLDAFILKTYGG